MWQTCVASRYIFGEPVRVTMESQMESQWETQASNTHAVSVKLPTFTSADPFTWFVRIEAQFRSKNISVSQTKSDFVLQALPEAVCNKISSFLRENPSSIDYDELKAEVLKKYSMTSSERVQKVLELICHPLGDRKPSSAWEEISLLLRLDEIDENGIPKEVDLKRELWLQHLPEPIRAGLHNSSYLSMENLLQKADNLQISNRSAIKRANNIPVICTMASHYSNNLQSDDESNSTDIPVSPVLKARQRKTTVKANIQKNPHRNNDRNNTNDSSDLCFYHRKWGSYAKYCTRPCSWKHYAKN